MHYRIEGRRELSGSVTTNISKNAAVAMLCASLLNRGKTTLRRMPRIEEIKRLVEVMTSIGVSIEWGADGDMVIMPPERIDLASLDQAAAEKTRSIAMFAAPLAHLLGSFTLPVPGGCKLGNRSMSAHELALAKLGIRLSADADGNYRVETGELAPADVVMYEASDTGVENVLMAAAKIPGTTTIRFASANYMVQDLCVFLAACGVAIEGIGTSTLIVHGVADIDADIEGFPSEDPIESMFFCSLAATTGSPLTVERCPIDFLELELMTLEQMGVRYDRSEQYLAANGHTRLLDITIHAGGALVAPEEKIAPRPYPGINIDNLPFFVPVATQAAGRTLIHDWVYEARALHYMEMTKLGADMLLADPHRVFIEGPAPLSGARIKAPPALRPATILLIGMLAADGDSELLDVYPINRGYERLHERLAALGAGIEAVEGE
ncbi:MAG TPA: UDP-N-acetylglucosamine 1-carboxyvinyltransferase [Candidatus Paceibacterota bacterium]|nr:UDP-N-acetylglucosamine 1-carboxyvinyltransferase [Candidatus Paceibacterota bacterium]